MQWISGSRTSTETQDAVYLERPRMQGCSGSRTSTGQRSFHYRGVKIWNELDRALKHIPSLRVFKSRLRDGMVEAFLRGASE